MRLGVPLAILGALALLLAVRASPCGRPAAATPSPDVPPAKDVATTEPGEVGAPGGLPAAAASWSGAGRLVALELDGRVEVRLLSGALLRVLAGERPRLSADGAWLLAEVPLERSRALLLAETEGGAAMPLPGRLIGSPVLSPSRDRAAIVLEAGGSSDVYLLDLPARESAAPPALHRLTQGGGAAPRFVAGDRLLYERPGPDGGSALVVRDAGGLGAEEPFWGPRRDAPTLSHLPSQA